MWRGNTCDVWERKTVAEEHVRESFPAVSGDDVGRGRRSNTDERDDTRGNGSGREKEGARLCLLEEVADRDGGDAVPDLSLAFNINKDKDIKVFTAMFFQISLIRQRERS